MSAARSLKLEVVLKAIDKITRPIKEASTSSVGLARTLKETRDQLKQLNSAQGQIDSFRKLSRDAAITGNQLKAAQDRVRHLSQELATVDKPTAAMTRQFQQATREASALKQRSQELSRNLQMARGRLEQAGISTRSLASHQQTLKQKIASTTASLQQQETRLARVNAQQKRLAAAHASYGKLTAVRDKVAGNSAGALAAGTATGAAVMMPVREYAQAEDAATQLKVAMMGAGKKVSSDFGAINKLAVELGNRLPGTTADFQNMMTALVRQGISAKAILGGVGEAAAYLGVQLKLPFEQAADFAAKMQDATGTTEKDMMGLMDVIQRTFYVGVDSSNMLNAFAKLSPALDMIKQKGLAGAKVLAPLLAMADQQNLSGESAGNAFRKVFQRSMDAKKIAKGNKLIKAAGLDFKLDFTNGKGEFGGLDKMFNQAVQLQKLNTQQRNAVIAEIWGDDAETLQALNMLINKGKAGYDEMAKKMADQASLQERVNEQLGTLKNLWDAASGTFTNAMVNFGEAIAPELKAVTAWIGSLSERMGDWAKANPTLANTLMKTAAVLAVVLTVTGALGLAVASILGPIAMAKLSLSVLGIRFGILGKGAAEAGSKVGLMRSIFNRIGSAATWVGSKIGTLRNVLTAVLGFARAFGLGLVQAFVGPVSVIAKTIFMLSRLLLTTPIGLIITGIAALAYYLWSNWEVIGPKFWGLIDQIKQAFATGWAWIKSAASSAAQFVVTLFMNWSLAGIIYRHWDSIMAFMASLPGRFTQFGTNIMQGLVGGITNGLTLVKSTIMGAGESTIAWFKEKLGIHSPSRVFAQLGGWTMAGLEQGLTDNQGGPMSAVKGIAKSLTAAGAGIALTAGSAVAGINLDTRPPIAARSPATAAPVASQPIQIIVQPAPGMNEERLAKLVAAEVERIQRKQAARGRSKLTDND
ncbi:phage tail tape measure protein [Crenobacter sp. SG2305]|uniref:phage tail tape measure protein n=1 Tax=Crenobacter oryzisoli TaxID=3056844 RepID=UPI0025AB144E|nr:phage tail tape measure protein [Crenobacter sp. SG2305]MDN0081623.1 phage tail tape measure protein [Crenobacter sp. SG2305]